MADTAFTDTVTLTDDDWFNDLNRLHYTIFGDPATAPAAFSAIKQLATASSTGVLRTAVQSDMEAVTSALLAVTPSFQQYHPAHPKAFAKWTSTTTVPIAYNISTTIVKNAEGSYTLRFPIPFSSSSLIVPQFGCDDTGAICQGYVSTMTVSTCTVVFRNSLGVLVDSPNFYASFFGDQ